MELDDLLKVLNQPGDQDDPPGGDPPAGDPPAGDPPGGDPPAGDPPKGDPPKGDPPKGDPPKQDLAAQFGGALDAMQFSTMVGGEVNRFFADNPMISDPQIRHKITSLAFAKAKQDFASGKMKSMYETLEDSAEQVKEELVRMLQAGGPMLRDIAIRKGKDKKGEFWKKASEYSMSDYFKDYFKTILPAMTKKGVGLVQLKKGYGQDSEEHLMGTADNFKRTE